MDIMNIRTLRVTQCGLRSVEWVQLLSRLLEETGVEDLSLSDPDLPYSKKPVVLARFDDGKLYVRDGHHRVVAIHVGNLRTGTNRPLYADEYVVEDWTYDQWMTANPARGWITPFDPRTEIRLGDLSIYKKMVDTGIPPSKSVISLLQHLYKRERKGLHTVEDLWIYVCSQHGCTSC